MKKKKKHLSDSFNGGSLIVSLKLDKDRRKKL